MSEEKFIVVIPRMRAQMSVFRGTAKEVDMDVWAHVDSSMKGAIHDECAELSVSEKLTLDDRLAHFEEYCKRLDDRYGAEVMHHARKRITKLEAELGKATADWYNKDEWARLWKRAAKANREAVSDLEGELADYQWLYDQAKRGAQQAAKWWADMCEDYTEAEAELDEARNALAKISEIAAGAYSALEAGQTDVSVALAAIVSEVQDIIEKE